MSEWGGARRDWRVIQSLPGKAGEAVVQGAAPLAELRWDLNQEVPLLCHRCFSFTPHSAFRTMCVALGKWLAFSGFLFPLYKENTLNLASPRRSIPCGSKVPECWEREERMKGPVLQGGFCPAPESLDSALTIFSLLEWLTSGSSLCLCFLLLGSLKPLKQRGLSPQLRAMGFPLFTNCFSLLKGWVSN